MRARKLIGSAFLIPPVAVFAVFAVGEGIGLEPGWWGHLLQLGAAVLLAGVAWLRPRIGGPLLIVAAAAVAGFVLWSPDTDRAATLSTLAIVVLPLVVAGVFFTLAGRTTPRVASHG